MAKIRTDINFKEKITPHLQRMFSSVSNPASLENQFIYSNLEDDNEGLERDPTLEDNIKICSSVYQCYEERALLLVTNRCFAHCRFCTRRHIIDDSAYDISIDDIQDGLEIIKKSHEIREVIISGGDPLVLGNVQLRSILDGIEQNKRIKVIRIDSRALTVCPERITSDLIDILRRHKKIWFVTHFNNASEISDETEKAVNMLLEAGIPLLNQSVFLESVNDREEDIIALNRKLVEIGVKPYYLYLCDKACGTKRFQCETRKTLAVLKNSFKRLSGIEIPYIVYVSKNGIKHRFTINKNDTVNSLLERINDYV